MNGKYALALILALQVSMSLCEIPPPEQELVDKYEAMRHTFYQRLLNAFGKLQRAVAPALETMSQHPQGQEAKLYVERLQANPHINAAIKVASGMAEEAAPLMENARTTGLGLYGHYLRPHIGGYLDSAINYIKVYLNEYLPTEN